MDDIEQAKPDHLMGKKWSDAFRIMVVFFQILILPAVGFGVSAVNNLKNNQAAIKEEITILKVEQGINETQNTEVLRRLGNIEETLKDMNARQLEDYKNGNQ